MSVSYAKTREQFGVAIGSFQAIKHRCADMGMGAALADAQLTFAALSLSEGQPDAAVEVAAARTVAHRTALWNARECVQVFGGIGFTWEHDQHLYLRRLTSDAAFFGDPAWHRERLCQLSGI
jgi:alkylation response protein AidB-like acyl-CoA dehydrogenase